MKSMPFVIACCLFTTHACTALPSSSWEEIPDQSGLTLLNPELQHRRSCKLRLQNGLEAYLISDPGADQSSAMVSVGAGSWSDPVEFPGMAHFCEHMLFMGTETYPNENEFWSVITDGRGMTNAFTAPHQTAFMFSSQPERFLELLDRFGHFFIDPLFNPSGIARELHAVDQEFAKNIENDGWRQYQILKETGNPNHPNHLFSTGNADTLGQIPQSALKEWYRTHYGANQMHLAIYSSLPLEELQQTTLTLFSQVPTSPTTELPSVPLTSSIQRGHITYIQPIKACRDLTLFWELPLDLAQDSSKTCELIAYTLQHSNVEAHLKEKEWVHSFAATIDELGGPAHRFLQLSFDLTAEGLTHLHEVVQLSFEALALLKQEGIPVHLFEEKNRIAELTYQYQNRQHAFQVALELARTLSEEPLATYPRQQLFSDSFQPERIQYALSLLTPERCIIQLLAPSSETGVLPTHTETWMGAEYTIRPLALDWIQLWAHATVNDAIQLPPPNPYVPRDLTLSPPDDSTVPQLLCQTESGTAYYIRSSEFPLPEIVYQLHIASPYLTSDPRGHVLANLYLEQLNHALLPTLTQAESAGLHATLTQHRARLHLTISGFSDQAPLLWNQLLKVIATLPPLSPNQFALYVDRHRQQYGNSHKELAIAQAKECTNALINPDRTTSHQCLNALGTLSYEEYCAFTEQLFSQSFLEALFAGNISQEMAETLFATATAELVRKPFPEARLKTTQALQLASKGGPFSLFQTTEAQGNATLLLIDQGSFDYDTKACQEILDAVLGEAFFTELRTKQKTGYIAQSACLDLGEELYQFFAVQSNSHQPQELLYRFELFLEEMYQELPFLIPESRFTTLQTNQVQLLTHQYRNLQSKSALWDLLAFEKGGDFQYMVKRIDALQALSYEKFLATAQQFLSRDNRKRLAVLYEGKLSNPFYYRHLSLTEREQLGTYPSRKEGLVAQP